jgi:hypothetical protein
MTGSHSALRAHLDVHAMLANLRETRGRPAFRSVGTRSLSTDGCFSRCKSTEGQTFVDVSPFPKSLRSPSKSLTEAGQTPRGTSRSSSTQPNDASHLFPFRSSSNQAPVPAREYIYTPSQRSPSERSMLSAVPRDAVILKRRDVNAATRRSSVQQADHEASVQRVVKLRYQEVTAAGQRRFPALLRRAAASRSTPVVEVAPTTRVPPEQVWLHVKPGTYTVSSLPSSALNTVASFLPVELRKCFSMASKKCFAAAADASTTLSTTYLLRTIPSGYFQALGLVEAELQHTTVTMMAIVLLLAGEVCEDVLRVAQTPGAVVALWKEKFPTGDVDVEFLLTDLYLEPFKGPLSALLTARSQGKTPGDIFQTAELEDANAALIVSRAMTVVEWNTESF